MKKYLLLLIITLFAFDSMAQPKSTATKAQVVEWIRGKILKYYDHKWYKIYDLNFDSEENTFTYKYVWNEGDLDYATTTIYVSNLNPSEIEWIKNDNVGDESGLLTSDLTFISINNTVAADYLWSFELSEMKSQTETAFKFPKNLSPALKSKMTKAFKQLIKLCDGMDELPVDVQGKLKSTATKDQVAEWIRDKILKKHANQYYKIYDLNFDPEECIFTYKYVWNEGDLDYATTTAYVSNLNPSEIEWIMNDNEGDESGLSTSDLTFISINNTVAADFWACDLCEMENPTEFVIKFPEKTDQALKDNFISAFKQLIKLCGGMDELPVDVQGKLKSTATKDQVAEWIRDKILKKHANQYYKIYDLNFDPEECIFTYKYVWNEGDLDYATTTAYVSNLNPSEIEWIMNDNEGDESGLSTSDLTFISINNTVAADFWACDLCEMENPTEFVIKFPEKTDQALKDNFISTFKQLIKLCGGMEEIPEEGE